MEYDLRFVSSKYRPHDFSVLYACYYGNTGRITKNDIINYINTRTSSGVDPATQAQRSEKQTAPKLPKPEVNKEAIYSGGEYEIVEMDRMRKLIAEHMVQSKQISPHVTSFIETDVTNMVNWRNKNKEKTFGQHKRRIRFLFI